MHSYSARIGTLVLIVAGFTLSGCLSTEPVRDRAVEHQYQDTRFSPSEVTQQLDNGLQLTIEPVDASFLNEVTFEAALRDGGYEQEYINVRAERRREISNLDGSERRRVESYIEATERLEEAAARGRLNDVELTSVLMAGIWSEDMAADGSEVARLSDNPYLPTHNPYLRNGNYLSVFRLVMTNPSENTLRVRLEDLQIMSGSELTYPLKMSHFEDYLPNPSSRRDNILRMNMPEQLALAPGTTIEKYIAVPALNVNEKQLSVQYLSDHHVASFDFDTASERTRIAYTLKGFRLGTPSRPRSNEYYDIHYAVRYADGSVFPIINDTFYLVDEEATSAAVDVCALLVSRRSEHQLACEQGIVVSERSDGNSTIALDFVSF